MTLTLFSAIFIPHVSKLLKPLKTLALRLWDRKGKYPVLTEKKGKLDPKFHTRLLTQEDLNALYTGDEI